MWQPHFSFTQPVCPVCYVARYPGREPAHLTDPDPETCCDCGAETSAGIYIRVYPAEVAHPTRTKDD